MYDLIVVGGGAAGFFGAAVVAERTGGRARILIVEQGRDVLQKVRISGGGRCNVTHAEFEPQALARHYPRGARELRGPFSRFAPGETMAWFEDRGVALKVEADGRVFPVSDRSASVVGALTEATRRGGVDVRLRTKVLDLGPTAAGWRVSLAGGEALTAKHLLLACGSAPAMLRPLAALGLGLVPQVPSLFSFNVPDRSLHELTGLSVSAARVQLAGLPYATTGSLLITHWGVSGPAVLRMSAEAAVELHACGYDTSFSVSWTGEGTAAMEAYLRAGRAGAGRQTLAFDLALGLPRRLWRHLVARAGLAAGRQWASLTKEEIAALASALGADAYPLLGQTRFKEEFVTAGGIELREVDFRTFGLRRYPGLYAAGEILNVDGVTGGFNFQAAWTGGYHAGVAIAASLAAETAAG